MLTLDDIRSAQQRIHGVAFRTPLLPYPGDRRLYLKPENFQPVGAFKIRGAYNAIASLTAGERERGVVAHSSGNHAQAVAYAARALGLRAVIVMPHNTPRIKVEKTASYGAEIVLVGNSGAERIARARELAEQQGLVPIEPYDDERVMAGQGTLGLEILEDLAEVGLVLVPVSGGGLISGVAAALKLSRPGVRAQQIVSITPEQVARTLADGLRVEKLGALAWPHVQAYVDDIVTVSEDQIRAAMRDLALNARLVAEPSGAVTFAAWRFQQASWPCVAATVAVISGGNVEAALLAQVLAEAN